ncbi:hypothetical protein LTR16_003411 [Cryomyces antarcticus]|uniref:Transcription factor domain-containing protein n=1 Tax=Cryomyces antarcticus TaxID=329879 RepID=A0ABR0LY34_9PEZI|nr:hypothetical protein LTR39_002663 [Cryomyces antarcticus]KAK5256369.1 hypothetical protein LTR16_003411 [Cryomyces antarcticus]
MSTTQRRLEQCLYWSCFKSECEMRVELSLPQTTIADVEYPHMFPSPPSRPSEESGLRQSDDGDALSFGWHMYQYSNKAQSEEKSWYYYLTEFALRRISNRILNTFYRQDHTSWWDVSRLIPIAKEFEAQISVWSNNLPPAMQYDNHITGEDFSPSRELSWATWNRLLEMKTWLYQPFLYYAIHNNTQLPDLLENSALRSLIEAGMDCALKTVEHRTLRHRHHGLWFDIRAIVTASLTVMAMVKSGNVKIDEQWDGRILSVIRTLAFWEDESPDLVKTKKVLEELLLEMRSTMRRRSY